MSQIFWDHYLDFDDIYRKVGEISQSNDEKTEYLRLIDEITHHRLMGCILDNLDYSHHNEFLEKFTASPHDHSLTEFLKSRIKNDFETLIKIEMDKIKKELFDIISLCMKPNFKN